MRGGVPEGSYSLTIFFFLLRIKVSDYILEAQLESIGRQLLGHHKKKGATMILDYVLIFVLSYIGLVVNTLRELMHHFR